MANRIDVIIDVAADKAGSLRKFKSDLLATKTAVNDANGFFGKLKVGASGVNTAIGGMLKNPAGLAAGVTAAGAAALKFAGDAAELGVNVGKMADATGLSTEAASRWTEVAGDIGIDAGTIESAVGKMNKTAAATPGEFTK